MVEKEKAAQFFLNQSAKDFVLAYAFDSMLCLNCQGYSSLAMVKLLDRYGDRANFTKVVWVCCA